MIRRREVITLLGGAAVAWPLAARAQQPAMPVIGFMHSASPGPFATYIAAFRDGLGQMGYVEGRNIVIEYRWAEGRTERLPDLAAELVRRPVAVLIAAGGSLSALTAKRATSTIPVVFPGVDDAVKLGLVESLNRPGGNVTGVSIFNAVLAAKRLELLRELASKPISTAFLVNSKHPAAESQIQDLEEAAQGIGQKVMILRASSAREIEEAFATLIRERIDALVLGADPFFSTHAINSLIWLRATVCLQSISIANSRWLAASSATASTSLKTIAKRGSMRAEFSRARNLLTCRSFNPRSSSWSSTSGPPRRSAWRCHRCCSPGPTR
jgi:putative ABC transport system substrate-binding protein